jgi:hypothetical protein
MLSSAITTNEVMFAILHNKIEAYIDSDMHENSSQVNFMVCN